MGPLAQLNQPILGTTTTTRLDWPGHRPPACGWPKANTLEEKLEVLISPGTDKHLNTIQKLQN